MTAPHAALLMVSGGASDPYFSFVKQLTHFDGTNGSTTYTATVGPANFGTSGTTSLSTSEKAFGSASVSIATASNVNLPSNAAYTIAGNDFALEFWVRALTISGAQVYFDGRPGSEGAYPAIYASGADLFYYVNSANRISATGAMSATTWSYIAVARSGGNTRMYKGVLGGVTAAQVGSTYVDGTTYLQMPLRLGYGSFASGPAPGNYDDFRLTVGSARGYTGATILVPTAAFPNS